MARRGGYSEGCFVVCFTIFLFVAVPIFFMFWEANIDYTKVYRQFLRDIIPEDGRGMVESVEMWNPRYPGMSITIILKDEVFVEEDIHRMMEEIAARIDLLAEDAQKKGREFNHAYADLIVKCKVLDENNEVVAYKAEVSNDYLEGWDFPWKYWEYSSIYSEFLTDIVGDEWKDYTRLKRLSAPSPEAGIEIVMYGDKEKQFTEDETYQITKDIASRIESLLEDAQIEGKEFNQDMIFLRVKCHIFDGGDVYTYEAEGAYDSEVGWVFLWENEMSEE